MADVDLIVGGRQYSIACRDGGEDHLRTLAQHVDRKAQEAAAAVGGMAEARQLLFAALLIADELAESQAAMPQGPVPATPALDHSLIQLASRIEAIAEALETRVQKP